MEGYFEKQKNSNTNKLFRKYSYNFKKRKPNLIETDHGKNFLNKFFSDFLIKNNINWYSRYTSLGAVFAKGFNCTFRDLFGRPVFGDGGGIWDDILPTKIETIW